MKKIEIITKNHGKKKSQVIKVKKKSDLAAILTAVNFSVVKDNFHDIDLTGDVKFKVDGKKKSAREVRDIIRQELRSPFSSNESKSAEIKRDKDGRIVIGSRHSSNIKSVSNFKKKDKKKSKKIKDIKKVLNKKEKNKKCKKSKKKNKRKI